MNQKQLTRKIEQINLQDQLEASQSILNRSRSITVGTAFGGTTEIIMRGNGDKFMYTIMQPVEVLELIHQLAANVGCHIAVKPRDDFGSWREWRVSEAEKNHLNGWPPFVNDMAVFKQLGASGFNQEEAEQILENWLSKKQYYDIDGSGPKKKLSTKEDGNEKVATKKTVNRRSSK